MKITYETKYNNTHQTQQLNIHLRRWEEEVLQWQVLEQMPHLVLQKRQELF